MFPKRRVPQNGWFIIFYNGSKPYFLDFLMDDLGGHQNPVFGNTHMYIYIYDIYVYIYICICI